MKIEEALQIINQDEKARQDRLQTLINLKVESVKSILKDYEDQLTFRANDASGRPDLEIVVTKKSNAKRWFAPRVVLSVNYFFLEETKCFHYTNWLSQTLNPKDSVSVANFIIYAVRKLKL